MMTDAQWEAWQAQRPQLQHVLDDVLDERLRQDTKWGEQNHPDGTGPRTELIFPDHAYAEDMAVMARELCDRAHKAGQGAWLHILLEETFEAMASDDPTKLRAELVQVAAVAVQWIQAIDRRS